LYRLTTQGVPTPSCAGPDHPRAYAGPGLGTPGGMTPYQVVAEFDDADGARGALERLRVGGVARQHVEVSIRGERPAVAVHAGTEDEARVASGRLARAGAAHMQWLDGRGTPLRGPGRARQVGGWWRPGVPAEHRTMSRPAS
jgi:hypothetical protein